DKLLRKEIEIAKGLTQINLLSTLAEHSKDEKALKRLMPELKSKDFGRRFRAACVLAWPLKGPPEVIAILEEGLRSKDAAIPADAAHIVSWFEAPVPHNAVPALAAALDTPDYQVRREALLSVIRALTAEKKEDKEGVKKVKIDYPALIKVASPAVARV